MKKLYLKLKLFLIYIVYGLRGADKVAFGSTKDGELNSSTIEQNKHQDNVYDNLLNKQVTQEVIELRHEMYFSERESKHYEYSGGGLAKKKTLFSYSGDLEESDGRPVLIVQENKEIVGGYEDVNEYCEKVNTTFTMNVEREYLSKYPIENYTNKIVIKENDEDTVAFDLYTSEYTMGKRHSLFLKEMLELYQGKIQSEIIDFKNLSFVSQGAYGVDDYITIHLKNIQFETINRFDGNYVLRFIADKDIYGEDLIMQFYDEKTDEKCRNHVARNEHITAGFMNKIEEDSETINKETELYNEYKREKTDI